MRSFLIAYGLTVASLAVVVTSGLRGRRGLHFASIGATLAGLTAAIGFAERLGRGLVFEGAAATVKSVHFVVVYAGLALLGAMIVTGARVVRTPAGRGSFRRRVHRRFGWAFLASVVAATALGFAMTGLARPG